jgi:4-hydroxy-2-oxoglutarate aldolase
MKLQGIFPSITTPFDHKGDLYKVKVQHNLEKWNLTALSGYVAGGLTGEGVSLMFDEKIMLWEWVARSAAPEKLLIAGASAESVRETVELANRAHDLGYKAALIRPTRYSDAHALYFRAVADQSKLPIIIHNSPAVDCVAELSQHPNIIASIESAAAIAQLIRDAKPGFQVLAGSAQTLADSFAAGAIGGILAFANAAPYAAISIWEAHRTREAEAAIDWQNRITPAAQLVTLKYGVPGLKYAMDLNGYFGGPPRLPLTVITPEARLEIEQAFDGIKG